MDGVDACAVDVEEGKGVCVGASVLMGFGISYRVEDGGEGKEGWNSRGKNWGVLVDA